MFKNLRALARTNLHRHLTAAAAAAYVFMQAGRSLFMLWAMKNFGAMNFRNVPRITLWLAILGLAALAALACAALAIATTSILIAAAGMGSILHHRQATP